MAKRRPKYLDSPALAVACPRCRAVAGSPCTTYTGHAKGAHQERVDEWHASEGDLTDTSPTSTSGTDLSGIDLSAGPSDADYMNGPGSPDVDFSKWTQKNLFQREYEG